MRLSNYFKLGKKQEELDFVDIPLDTDMPLFIDPYALSKRNDLFSMQCSNIIINFFQRILDDIKEGNFSSAKQNLNSLSEPNDTRLGLSENKPLGKGVSGKQSVDVFEKLKNSKAVKTGFLKDLSDCELVISGISRDKISDIVTNVIKRKLIEYTEQQCKTYNIPLNSVSSGRYWNEVKEKWENSYVNLPLYKKTRIILVPKAIVRYSLAYNHQKFYNGFVLEYLQEEHLNSNTALVRLLKNGKRVVYKKYLKQDSRYKLTKEFLYEFSQDHPEVFEEYKRSLSEELKPLTDKEIEEKQKKMEQFDYNELMSRLKGIPAGKKHADTFHNAMVGILEAIFYPNLFSPNKEERIHDGRKIIDITYQNGANNGFFEYLAKHIISPFVICECKNYNEDPANPELDQLSGRFSTARGLFGIMLCRKIENKSLMIQRCKDTAKDGRGYIIVLDDEDVIQLLGYKKNGDEDAINKFLTDKYKELAMQ